MHEENSTATVATFTASDPDIGKFNNAFRFDLTDTSPSTDAQYFTITKVTGILKFKKAPNYEMPRGIAIADADSNIYMVTVNLRRDDNEDGEITTDDTLIESVDVMIKVVDEPEAPAFSSESVALDIDENKYPNMDLNRVVEDSPQAYDDDANRLVSLTYSLSGGGRRCL